MLDSTLRQKWQEDGEHFSLVTPDGWLQGRSVFGGLTVAAAAALAIRQVGAERSLRVATATLVRPLAPGSVQGRFLLLREGKSTTACEVQLHQGGNLTTKTTFVLATPRPASTVAEPRRRFVGPGPEGLQDLPYIPGVTPEFIQNVRLRWVEGAPLQRRQQGFLFRLLPI